MTHDAYYFAEVERVGTYAEPTIGDMVLVLHGNFRGADGEFAAGYVTALDDGRRPDEAEVQGADPMKNLAPAWFKLLDMALMPSAEDSVATNHRRGQHP